MFVNGDGVLPDETKQLHPLNWFVVHFIRNVLDNANKDAIEVMFIKCYWLSQWTNQSIKIKSFAMILYDEITCVLWFSAKNLRIILHEVFSQF